MSVVPFPAPPSAPPEYDATLDRLISVTTDTNLVALDKALSGALSANKSNSCRAAGVASIGERLVRAAFDLRQCLAPSMRKF